MKHKWLIPAAIAFVIVLLGSCAPPMGNGGDGTSSGSGDSQPLPTIANEPSQGIYVNEGGERFPIQAQEEGSLVKCVEAIDIVVLSAGPVARAANPGPKLKAVVVGKRDDGLPGVWAVYKDDTIHPAKIGGKKTSHLPDSNANDGSFRGFFGWTYEVVDADGGNQGSDVVVVVVGHAVNNRVHRWRWLQAEPQIGVYWKLTVSEDGDLTVDAYARIIGQLKDGVTAPGASTPFDPDDPNARRLTFLWRVLSSLRLFFISFYENYLIQVKSVEFVEPTSARALQASGNFVIKGVDKDDQPSVVSLATTNEDIVIAPDDPPPPPPPEKGYDRLYVATFEVATTIQPVDTSVKAVSDAGTEVKLLQKVDDPNNDPDAFFFDLTGLEPGGYRIEVTAVTITGIVAVGVEVLETADDNPTGFSAFTRDELGAWDEAALETTEAAQGYVDLPFNDGPLKGRTIRWMDTSTDVDILRIVIPPLP